MLQRSYLAILTLYRVPSNVRFIIDDLNQEWSFPADSFDFIHVRGLAGCVDDWSELLGQCYEYVPNSGKLDLWNVLTVTQPSQAGWST
jgi:hypothetical protein